MEKLKTGIATNMDFIKKMEEKGESVKAEFPAETLKRQLKNVGENNITFVTPYEQVLENVNSESSEPIPSEESVTIEDIEGTLETITTDYYNTKPNETLTIDTDDVKTAFYSNLGSAEETETITIGEEEYDNTEKSISLGKNSYLKAPVFKVDEGNLIVSTLHLVAEADNGEVNVVCGDKTFKVSLGEASVTTPLKVIDAKGICSQEKRKNEVEHTENSVTQTSNSGKHGVGIKLGEEDSPIEDEDICVYRIDEDKNMGITKVEKVGEETFTYTTYLKYKDGDYDDEDVAKTPITRNCKLIVVGKGIAEITTTLNIEKYSEDE